MKITLIIGLPCSGKTTLAETMVAEHGGVLIDDPTTLEWLNREDVKKTDRLILTDPYLCKPGYVDKAIGILRHELFDAEADNEFELIYFENNPEACIAQSKLRPNKKVESLIRTLTDNYKVPEFIKERPVYQGEVHV